MSQHVVGTGLEMMLVVTEWGWEKFLKIQQGWDGVGNKLCGNGWVGITR